MTTRTGVFLALALAPSVVRAGGLELAEQSPQAIAMCGAQVAIANDASAVYSNPAGMTFQRGMGTLGGVNILRAETNIKTDAPPTSNDSKNTAVAPILFGMLRLGPHFAIGVGSFVNFGILEEFSPTAPSRFSGTQINLQTVTINPSLAIRPHPRISIGFGLDVIPSTFEIKKALNFGSGEGAIHASGSGTGVGGNLGLLVRIVPQYLDFGFSYRSAAEIDFDGKASLATPPELAGQASPVQNAKTSLTLPHNMQFGLATKPVPQLTLSVEGKLTLWESFDKLTLTVTDPDPKYADPLTGKPKEQKQSQVLNFQTSWGVRLGLEYRVLDERLALRIGGGFDKTPVPDATLGPLAPDADRGLVSLGLGYHGDVIGVDAGYLLAILLPRTSTNPDIPGFKFDSIGHVVSIAVTLRFDSRINDPAYKH